MEVKNKVPILIDFDGIIKIGHYPADDAKIFLEYIANNKIPSFIISNSTLRTSFDLKNFLSKYNIDFGIPVMTAVDAALAYVKDHYTHISLYCNNSIKNNFAEFRNDANPQAVVVGDLGEKWTYDVMNEIFRKVHEGADLIAMQKNKFWKPGGDKLVMDAGAFIKAIEYAASKEAILIGKPSPLYFKSALKQLGWEDGEEFIMIGDDIETDIAGAQQIGGRGFIVYTGKTKFPLPKSNEVMPDMESKNLTEAIKKLNEMNY